jgi:hypothetical protein
MTANRRNPQFEMFHHLPQPDLAQIPHIIRMSNHLPIKSRRLTDSTTPATRSLSTARSRSIRRGLGELA